MSQISENPVLNPEAGSKLRFQEITITPEIPRTIPELPPPPPPPDPEDSSEDAGPKEPPAKEPAPGRHRRTSTGRPVGRPPKEPKAEDDKPAPPKVRPPDFREWHDFGANFVFKWLCRGYVGYVFRGIDKERVLNAAELKALEPDAEMLSSATKPLAHMASRNKFLTKNGRAIIDSADGVEALIAVGMYANTIRRIARSHDAQRTPAPERKKKHRDIRVHGGNLHSRDESVREQPGGSNVEEPTLRVVGEFGNTGFGVGG